MHRGEQFDGLPSACEIRDCHALAVKLVHLFDDDIKTLIGIFLMNCIP